MKKLLVGVFLIGAGAMFAADGLPGRAGAHGSYESFMSLLKDETEYVQAVEKEINTLQNRIDFLRNQSAYQLALKSIKKYEVKIAEGFKQLYVRFKEWDEDGGRAFEGMVSVDRKIVDAIQDLVEKQTDIDDMPLAFIIKCNGITIDKRTLIKDLTPEQLENIRVEKR